MKKVPNKSLLGSLVLLCSAPPLAFGQAASADDAQMQEIVVTAARREQRLQDVPIAVTAYSAGQIAAFQINDVVSAAQQTPNVTTVTAYSPADIRITIRGISTLQPSPSIDPSVGVYVDGVYYAVNTGSNLGFVDMERVELLKGPQGTLFGRNTIGGLLNITTAKPTYEFGGSASVGFGNYNSRTDTGVLNLPIVDDKLAVRLVYNHTDHSGYGTDTYLNQPLGDIDQDYVRIGVRADPTPDWNIDLTGYWSQMTGHSPPQKLSFIGTELDGYCAYYSACPPAVGSKTLSQAITSNLGGGFYDNQAAIDPPLTTNTDGATGTITGDLGFATFKSITGFSHIDEGLGASEDGTPIPFLQVFEYVRIDQISQEFQLLGDAFDRRLQWITGLYYFHDSGYEHEPSIFLSTTEGSGSAEDVSNSSYAAYAQGTYTIVPDLNFTAGVRYTRDDRAVVWHDQTVSAPNFAAFVSCDLPLAAGVSLTNPALCNIPAETSFHYVPWTVGLDYKINPDTLVYAKVSKGYRSGGFSLSGPPAGAPSPAAIAGYEQPFQPESALQPEIGLKLEAFDHKFRFNFATFYTDYSNIQLNIEQNVDGALLSVTRNVGKANIYGVEADFSLLVGAVRFNLSGGVVAPEYTSGPNVGLPFVNVSRYSFDGGVEYPFHTSYGTFDLTGDYSWRSTMYAYEPELGNEIQNEGARQDSFGLLDAKLKFDFADMPLTLSLWGKNLTAVQYKSQPLDYFGYALDSSGYIAGNPRTFGGTIEYRF